MFRVKRVKRKCNVLGCRHTDCYALTALGEYGNSVVICKDCLEKAFEAINEREEAQQKVDAPASVEPDVNNEGESIEPEAKITQTKTGSKKKKKGS